MASTLDLLKRLTDHKVEYIVVGGLAGVLHGSALVTDDVDLCIPLTQDNLSKILGALGDLNPRFRMSPERPPLPHDPSRLARFKNLYLVTDLGQIDFLTEISGIGEYKQVSQHAITVRLGGTACRVLDLDALIRSKKALGRPRDLQAARELEAIRERNRDEQTPPES